MNKTFSKIMILVTVIFMDILGGSEIDLFIPSFPELKEEFGVSPFWLEALLSVNFIGFCLSTFFIGGLADRYGRKPIILYSLIIFVIGSVLCLWAASFEFLLVGRFFQGIGVAAPAILCFLIVADLYPIKEQQFLMAILNSIVNLTIAAAPIAGSYITMYFHWHGNFTALFLLSSIVLVMTIVFIPAHKPPKNKESISLQSYMPILKSKPMMLLIANLIFMFTPYWIFLGMSSILYMDGLGVSLAHYGYYQGAWALIFAFGSLLSGLIIKICDSKKLLKISSCILVVSFFIIACTTIFDCRNPLLIMLGFLPFSIAGIIPGIITYPLFLNMMPQAKGKVSALFSVIRLIFTGIALELAGYYYVGSFQVIGTILTVIILFAVITTFMILRNQKIMGAIE